MLLILHPLFKESLIFQIALPLAKLGPHGLDLMVDFLCPKSWPQKNDLGKDVLAFRTKNKRVFLSILPFFTDLILIDHFLRFQSIPEEKWLPFSREFRFPRLDSPETARRSSSRIRCPRLPVQLFGSSSDDISQLPGDLMAGTT